MKYFSYLIFFFFSCCLHAQNDTLNRTDSNNCKQGYWRSYKESGGKTVLLSEGMYSNNLKQGLWMEYYGDGKVKSSLEFKDGRVYGKGIVYYEDGSIQESGTFRNVHWLGDYVSYYQKNHQPEKIYHYNEAGKRDGCQVHYYEDGSILSESEFENGREKISKFYYKNGRLREFSIGDSVVETYYENGKKETSKHFINGKRNYSEVNYYENGTISSESSYRNDKRNGVVTFYYQNGIIKYKFGYKDGRMDGERIIYNKNGEPVKGKFTFYSDSLVAREGFCINGRPEGELKVYDDKGQIAITANFKNGKADGLTCYYSAGKIYLTEKYADGVFVEEITK